LNLIKWRGNGGCVHKFRLINRVSAKWESFGRRLEIPSNVLQGWREECQADAAKCWNKVMEYWLAGHPATWESVYELLEDLEYTTVAKELKDALSAAMKQTMSC
jgi:hypothetical protein